MAADDLFFLRTGEETKPFVLVRLAGDAGKPDAEASIVDPSGAGGTGPDAGFEGKGDLPSVLREANEHALLQGLDLRIELNGRSWPEGLGILGNADQAGN